MTTRLPETTYAVLGLVDKRPDASGYLLAQLAAQSFAYFWPISRTLLYRELRRLEGLGWVSGTAVRQQRAPEKHTYRVTAEGQRRLAAWLARPGHPPTQMRSGFLLKFFFANRMQPDAAIALLADYQAEVEAQRDQLTALADKLADQPRARAGRLAALHGVRTAEARLAWVKDTLRELTAG